MEEMLLRVCVVVVSLLYVKDPTVFQEQEEKLLVGMQEREYLLQKEAVKIEQEVEQVTTEVPHSNQEVSQSQGRFPNAEDNDSGVQLMENGEEENLHDHRMPDGKHLDVVHQNLLIKDIQDDGVPLTHDHNNKKVIENTVMKNTKEISAENFDNCYLLTFLSLLSLIRLLRTFASKGSQRSQTTTPIKDKTTSRSTSKLLKNIIPGQEVLCYFYDRHVRVSPSTCGRVCEFVEGLTDELLEAARNVSNDETDLQIGDLLGVGSLYELWATSKTMVCDLYVPITAPKYHAFDVELWKEKDASLSGFGQVKVVKVENISNGCPCMDGNPDDDLLCLLHPHTETNEVLKKAVGWPLCKVNTPYLSKKQVVRWFRTTILKAWREIRHKYELDLGFRNRTSPGDLRVRFRSGQTVLLNITPVVQVKTSQVYLLSYLSTNQNISDTQWPISFANYEKALFQYFNKTLPDNSCHIPCLQILSFLHQQQNSLTGTCGLTSYHLKSTFLHLLISNPTGWKHEHLNCRLRDMLMFLEQRFQAKVLSHALIGNPVIPKDIKLPKEFQTAKPNNIFLPMALDEERYQKSVQHLQELVKNTPILIQEYGYNKWHESSDDG